MRYFIEITYHGAGYAGWQSQLNATGVQAVVEEALFTLLRQATPVTGAGRTDAGVHARQLFAHFDTEIALPDLFVRRMNGVLPQDIAVIQLCEPQPPDLHARFDAVSRAYEYVITTRKSPLHMGRSMWVKQELDVEAMRQGAALLLEYEDFASFCKAHGQQETTLCTLTEARWEEQEHLLIFHIRANRFLRGMVRGIVGTLISVGKGHLTVGDFRRILEAQDRQAAGMQADACGLTLTEVTYPEGSLRTLSRA